MIDHLLESASSGRKVFIFGAPFQYLELCRELESYGLSILLKRSSLVLIGGGWKGFDGEKVERTEMEASLVRSFGLESKAILEGYSMTESSILTMRCDYGRFHFPPLMEPVFLDESLRPIEAHEADAIFGFLDPLATSYPGFIITSDRVHMVRGDCACGLTGAAVTSIGRYNGDGVKGCGGIMGTMRV